MSLIPTAIIRSSACTLRLCSLLRSQARQFVTAQLSRGESLGPGDLNSPLRPAPSGESAPELLGASTRPPSYG
jgi:hypothetical protein